MKPPLLSLFVALLISLACNAQTQKGAMMIGGSGSIGLKDGFSVGLWPNLGFFVTEDLAIGSGLPLGYSKRNDYSNISGGLQPFVRYYFGKPAATRVFAQVDGLYILYRSKGSFPEDPDRISTYTQNSFGGGLGLVHFITEQVGLEAKLSYRNGQISSGPRRDGLNLSFGIQIHQANSEK